jgi:HPt (histidine-containing phosphotransfer) domain-containing protein
MTTGEPGEGEGLFDPASLAVLEDMLGEDVLRIMAVRLAEEGERIMAEMAAAIAAGDAGALAALAHEAKGMLANIAALAAAARAAYIEEAASAGDVAAALAAVPGFRADFMAVIQFFSQRYGAS